MDEMLGHPQAFTHAHTYTHVHVHTTTNKFMSIPTYMGINMYSYTDIYIGGARGVMVIVVGNGRGDTSSNPGRD